MSKCIHANKLHDNLWCSTACMYCTLSQEEMCRHRKDIPGTNIVKTNADHIRNMSDKELAEILIFWEDDWGRWWTDAGCVYGNTADHRERAVKAELDWLKQPYKEDA